MKRNFNIAVTLTVLAIFGLATLAFAGWGRGYGHRTGPGMMGPGWQQGGGYYGNLSADEREKLDAQRAEFFAATEETRQQLYEKNRALQNELAKEDPDTSVASELQSEISELRHEIDQKRLAYDIQARKSSPGYGRGRGGYGSGMGYGPRGGGYCRY